MYNDFEERIKVDKTYENPEEKKKVFMKRFEEEPELLEVLSTERLELVLKYYQNENEKKRRILKKLCD